jgi:hypothetical protein
MAKVLTKPPARISGRIECPVARTAYGASCRGANFIRRSVEISHRFVTDLQNAAYKEPKPEFQVLQLQWCCVWFLHSSFSNHPRRRRKSTEDTSYTGYTRQAVLQSGRPARTKLEAAMRGRTHSSLCHCCDCTGVGNSPPIFLAGTTARPAGHTARVFHNTIYPAGIAAQPAVSDAAHQAIRKNLIP